MDILKMSDVEVLAEARKLRYAYQLKRTLRYATKRDFTEHSESVAEHVFGLLYLAHYFVRLEDPDQHLDREKIYDILLFHDFGEIIHGDVPYPHKTAADRQREKEDVEVVFDALPALFRQDAYARLKEYEERNIPEARFAYAIDKIESLFELFDSVNERSPKRLKQTYESHITVKLRATEHFPIMRRFVEVISKDMRQRGIFAE